MNIVICAGVLDKISGYNLATRRLGAEFRKRGHRVLILCHQPPVDISPDANPEDFIVCSAKVILRRAPLFRILDRFRPDVVFTHNVALSDLMGFRYARKRGIPVFSMFHTRYSHYVSFAIPWKPLRFSIFGRVFERWVAGRLKKSTTVFAPTEDMKAYLENLGLTRVEVAGGGVDRTLIGPGEERKPESDSGRVRLLFVGQIRAMKNQIYLLEMSRFLPGNYRLDLVGGKCWDRGYYRKFLKAFRSGRYPNVEWHGELEPRETARFFRTARVFVNASLLEAQGLAQIEALASGLPTVRLHGARTSGVTVDLETAIHLDEKASPRKFAEAVVRLVEDDRLCEDIRRRALAEGGRYSWKTTAERILACFAAVVKPAEGILSTHRRLPRCER
ncbi:MAG: glycosyltransferase family 4 protein [Candidatus Aminicenantes bacterium]|nr:glycosyltransferase family 4 protein [Candidatus Aminicenantes bacterium]